MRVNISQSVEVEKVPNHIIDMLSEKIDFIALKELYESLCKNLQPGASLNAIKFCAEQVSDLRAGLYEVDTALQDCTTVLNGYVEILQQPSAPVVEQVAAEASDEETENENE